jgi:hypothetical protein
MKNAANAPRILVSKAETPAELRREQRTAEIGRFGVTLAIWRDSYGYSSTRSKKGFVVCWSTGAKRWQVSFKTEAEAVAFADTKWATLLTWLEKRAAELCAA